MQEEGENPNFVPSICFPQHAAYYITFTNGAILIVFYDMSLMIRMTSGYIRVSNRLDPDQARQIVRPDLDPNCLQRLSAEELAES